LDDLLDRSGGFAVEDDLDLVDHRGALVALDGEYGRASAVAARIEMGDVGEGAQGVVEKGGGDGRAWGLRRKISTRVRPSRAGSSWKPT
jgi:hypothetical protein